MRYGIVCNFVLGQNPTGEDVLRFAQRAEALGFSSFAVSDHVIMPRNFDSFKYPAGVFDSGIPWYDSLCIIGGHRWRHKDNMFRDRGDCCSVPGACSASSGDRNIGFHQRRSILAWCWNRLDAGGV